MDEKRFLSRDLRLSSCENTGDYLLNNSPMRQSERFSAIKNQYESSPQSYDDAVAAAKEIGAMVRSELTFAPSSAMTPYLTPESLADTKTTNCYGHTIVASECLEAVGVEHMISYANQHSFITLFDRESRGAFMIDVAVKDFYVDISDVIGGKDPLDQIQEGNLRAENSFYSLEFLKKLPAKYSFVDTLQEREWLSFVHPGRRDDWDDESRFRLQLLSYPSIPGREMLVRYYNGLLATSKKDPSRAYEELQDLNNIYPDIDERNHFEDINKTIQELMKGEYYFEAQELADMVSGSIDTTCPTDNRLYRLKIKRRIAQKSLNLSLIDQAINEYETIGGRRVSRSVARARKERQDIERRKGQSEQ